MVRPIAVAVGGLAAALSWGAVAMAGGLSAAELEQLAKGQVVVRSETVERENRRYVGGVAYTVIDESATDLVRLLEDVGAWKRILPQTRTARRVSRVGNDELVELTNGTAWLQATDTIRVRREGPIVRFWIDPSRPHDVEDAWGFVRAEPMSRGRALVSYGVLIDLGPGIVRDLFEDGVRKLALSVPDRLRAMVTERNAAGARAAR